MLSDLRPGRELFAWRLHEASKLLAPFGIDPRARLLERHRFPVATLGLLLLIFVFFGWEILESGGLGPGALSLGGGFSLEALLALGANANVITVQEGQWWRLVTSTLLHGGLLHIGLNAFYLWTIGSALERSIGPGMLVFAFALTGVVGSAASALLGAPNVLSVGASGALFGWVGLLSTVGEGNVAQRLGRLGRAAPSLFLMLFIGFLIPNVDVWAHVGGLLAGLLLGLSYRRPSARERQVFGVLGALTLAWGIVSLLLWRGSL
nr:rhomboid family intramembrane serine protease [Deinobacterium chartae]